MLMLLTAIPQITQSTLKSTRPAIRAMMDTSIATTLHWKPLKSSLTDFSLTGPPALFYFLFIRRCANIVEQCEAKWNTARVITLND